MYVYIHAYIWHTILYVQNIDCKGLVSGFVLLLLQNPRHSKPDKQQVLNKHLMNG